MLKLLHRLQFDGWLSVIFVICACAAFAETFEFPENAAVWPRWVIGCFALLCGILVLVKLRSKP